MIKVRRMNGISFDLIWTCKMIIKLRRMRIWEMDKEDMVFVVQF
jgi:hypothetical protein